MVLPFSNEIWLDIFHGLAKEGEYDALERCRAVCREFRPMAEECLLGAMSFISTEEVERIRLQVPGCEMRRWRGPQTVGINGGNWNDGHRPIPHLATFASRFGGRWPAVEMLWISNAMWQAADLDADAVFRDLARFPITVLFLYDIIFPTILTLGRLLDAILSRPVFDNLAHVNVDIHTTDGLDVQDEKRANDLRVCLAKLDARGILGILVNFTRMGLRWDYETRSWKRCGVERGAAQDDVNDGEVTRVDDESCTTDADSRTTACSDTGAVLAALQVGSASLAVAETPSSSLTPNARIATELARGNGTPEQDATTGSEEYVRIYAPEEHVTNAESFMGTGLSKED
ncbi:hypothetical protein POSPLADRAFT_1052627 [Postia placenta MAD-698-R-SB12]|uniref:F-box domain-containing protein n=1 Tax=Postia placenta MAD-698-R-SB12 TaxID=670580 RepID=A0A1X6NBF1_9APHY|nr:hypothetical protein POSPLADRAFT_1052627 [Postia placenta MAD-698-R-SB12]OSX65967.1 hypothetical protein POSPLADRAFT_1052627 [Postia placenta MAD-698-R-SB12]